MSGTNIEVKRILLPTDFSAASAQAFPYAVSFARQFGASITLVYVLPTTLPAELSHIGIVLEEKRLAKEAETTLARVRVRDLPSDLAVQNIVLSGGPYHEICKAAGALGIDLIVMSTHGTRDSNTRCWAARPNEWCATRPALCSRFANR